MTIEVQCKCGRAYRVGAELAGRRMRCKQCQGVVTVPEVLEAEPEAEPDHEPDLRFR
ncbi:MAG TPA: hypothetical protein VF796_13975 [Humisphaera sp.]